MPSPAKSPQPTDATDHLVSRIVDLADDKKAINIAVINLEGKSSIADYFVIFEGTGDRHVAALADFIIDELKKEEIRPLHVDGELSKEWMVLDYTTVIVHIFVPHVRQKYALEDLWAKRRPLIENVAGKGENPDALSHT